ncbi:MAG: hypothetical protein R6U37_03035 [Dehalococcoidia bacterium]
MEKKFISCCNCGTEREIAGDLPPCQALAGWITVHQWEFAAPNQLHFCSPGCLKAWADSQVTRIPEIFTRSFEDER